MSRRLKLTDEADEEGEGGDGGAAEVGAKKKGKKRDEAPPAIVVELGFRNFVICQNRSEISAKFRKN